ncbi:MAG: hypothetical protein HC933_10075 [Pleurocapsa sp. SU_196_0]|nr:hypothetical protein [Pleurocapsa sp. SU_196_0]
MPFLDTDRELTRHSYYAATAPRAPAHAPLSAGEHRCDVAWSGAGLYVPFEARLGAHALQSRGGVLRAGSQCAGGGAGARAATR